MYLPPHFREDRLDVQHGLIRAQPFGALITAGSAGLEATHIPFVLDADASPLGTLRCHISKANRQWQTLDPQQDALIVFQGAHAYITPSWYALKAETGKVVPTWNYAIVHAYGRVRIVDDAGWLLENVSALTDQHEAAREQPWAVSDAPDDFIAGMLKGIVGLEIEISRIEGKWKASQNRGEADRVGVVAGLSAQSDDASGQMADMVRERSAH